MSSGLYLSQPGIVSALGDGCHEHLQALLGHQCHFFTQDATWVAGKPYYFGKVNRLLRELPSTLPNDFHSRNNQLLWHALAQIEPIIQQIIARYGKERVAVVMGTSTTGNEENKAAFEYFYTHHTWKEGSFLQEQQSFASPADFVRYVYDLKNMAYGVSTACTSGSRALISAARLLRLGLCDAVICGGVDTLSTLTINGFHVLEVLSSAQCRPFSRNRDGINIGEAAAVFVMTRESTDGLPFLGYACSSDAYHMSSPRPDAEGAIRVINSALQSAQLSPQDIQWVNLHGTGTEQNDAMEAKAVVNTLGNVSSASTKSLTGHTLGAAGALEAAFLWLLVNRQYNPTGQLPQHHFADEKDELIDNIHLTQPGEYFTQSPRIALSTSFAFGGNNTAIIIGEREND